MLETLYKRKSIRSYTGEPISKEELETIIKAANASPVGMGQYENLHLTIISNKEILSEIESTTAKMFNNPDMHPLYQAPTLILVSSKTPSPMMENVAYSNAAILVHNMALAATELNVGSCYIWGAVAALNQNKELLAKLNIPEDFIPCCGICLGKTNEQYTLKEVATDKITQNTLL